MKFSQIHIGKNAGPIPGGDKVFFSFFENGNLLYSVGKNKGIEGKWSVIDDKLSVDLIGMKIFFCVFKNGGEYSFFDPTGTLFGKFELTSN